jgi:hypothetical protein
MGITLFRSYFLSTSSEVWTLTIALGTPKPLLTKPYRQYPIVRAKLSVGVFLMIINERISIKSNSWSNFTLTYLSFHLVLFCSYSIWHTFYLPFSVISSTFITVTSSSVKSSSSYSSSSSSLFENFRPIWLIMVAISTFS